MEIISLVGVLILMLLSVAATGFWIWMLVDCAVNEPSTGNDKLIWVLIIVLTHGLGALLYFFVRRPERIREYGH